MQMKPQTPEGRFKCRNFLDLTQNPTPINYKLTVVHIISEILCKWRAMLVERFPFEPPTDYRRSLDKKETSQDNGRESFPSQEWKKF